MLYVLYALFFISCIVLIGSVLLQPGKTDAGALFTSNVSSAAFGPRGTASVLSKMTIIAAAIFMVAAFLISLPVMQGGVSVLETVGTEEPAAAPAEVPVVTTDGNTAVEGNAAPATQTNAAPEQPAANAQQEAEGVEPAANR